MLAIYSSIAGAVSVNVSPNRTQPLSSDYVEGNPASLQNPASAMSISQILDVALQNNPQTKTVWWNARRLAAAKGLERSAYYPDVAFRAKVAHGYDYQFTNGREVAYTDIEGGVILSYLLLDFGERDASSRAAAAALLAAEWQLNWTMQNVIFEVLNASYIYLCAQEILEAGEDSLKDLKESRGSVEELFRSGLRSVTDLYAIKATLAEAEMEIALQKSAVDIAKGNLNISMGLPFDSCCSLLPPADPPQQAAYLGALSNLIDHAEQGRADLQAKYAILAEKEALANKVFASFQPKLRFDGDVGCQRYCKDKSKGIDYNLALSFSIPLYNGGETTYRKRMSWADIQSENSDIEQHKFAIAKEIAVYDRQFKASQKLFDLVIDYMKNAEQAFEGALERYKAGTISIFDLTAAQKQLSQARMRRAEAKSSWYRNLAGLTFSLGVIATSFD